MGSILRAGDVVALRGPLGAGKTTFVRALVGALHGSDAAVSSPTFVFRQRYDAPGAAPVEHLDLYRVEDERELADLALDDAFGADRITVVEWPEHGESLLPGSRYDVAIAGAGDGPRTVRIVRHA